MATWRKWLDEAGFDWAVGRIVVQDDDGNRFIAMEDPILDEEFDEDLGDGPHAPKLIAKDHSAFYFSDNYDGSTSCVKVWRSLSKYAGSGADHIPRPGGGGWTT